ncbi:MAG: hypothetical protein E7015_02505 [Alphaproteobacteria bacterium]|nr:hypothetical protein [Alphaproteobacteria bacterium]
MGPWSKTDLIGFLFIILGLICLFCIGSLILSVSIFLIASVTLMYSIYEARFDTAKYRDILCHYQAILSASSDGWIAWNKHHEFINASKKFKELFGFNGYPEIFFSNIISSINEKDSEEFTHAFNSLQKTGKPLSIKISTIDSKSIKITGAKIIISGLETIVLWGHDITETSNLVNTIETDLAKTKLRIDSLYDILNAIPIQIWKRNSNLDIVFCNQAYANALDTSADQVILDNIPLIPGSIFGQGHSLAENVKKCGKELSVAQSVVINGHRKKLSIHECPIANDEYVGYAIDITEEESLAHDLDKIVTANCDVLENISSAIAIFGNDMRLSFFNTAYQQLMKLELSWLRSKPNYGEILDELRDNRQLPEYADFPAFKKTQVALFTSVTCPTQDLLHLPNGKSLRLVIAPYPLGGLIFIYEDVTDSLTLQRKNNTLLAVQKETLDHLYEGVMVYGSDNRIKIINNALLKIWQTEDTPAQELKGIHLSEMLDKIKDKLDYGNDWQAFRENAISNLTDRIAKTGKLIKKDHSVILFTYVPLPDGAHMNSFVDITDTCAVEKAVLEKNQALKTAQKLRFEFVSSVSTELKEPLNVLIGFAELLIHKYYGDLNDKQLEYCRFILSAANQLNALITNLLEMVSIDIESVKLQLSYFDLNATIEEVIQSLNKRISEKNIEIVCNCDSDASISNFHGDKIRIKQALFNILINAIQFTPPNEKIDLRIFTDSDQQQIKVIITDGSSAKPKTKTVFKRSSGKTINFLNIDSNSISMPLVRSLIELHGGNLQITSDNGNGTSVICCLPINSMQNNELLEQKDIAIDIPEVINS